MKKSSPLIEGFRIFIKTNVTKKAKAIITSDGTIKMSNDLNLKLNLPEGSSLITVFPDLRKVLNLTGEKRTAFFERGKSIDQQISLSDKDTTDYYHLIISPISTSQDDLLLVEISDITHYKEIEKTGEKQRDRIESELLLRTKEIVQTDLFTQDHGGFFTNFMRGLRHDLLSPVAQLTDIIAYYKKTENHKKKAQASQLMDNCLLKLGNTARGFSNFVDLFVLSQNQEESIHVPSIVENTKELLSSEITETEAQINIRLETDDTLIFNEKLTASIFYNLLSNAIKFRRTSVAPAIEIHTYKEDQYYTIVVKDNGVGIDLERYGQQLFTPFKRFHTDRPGNGVGLSMLKNSLVNCGGDIRMESTVGEGTVVTVQIPQP